MADEPSTELSQASFEGDLATVNSLLDTGVDHLEADASGRTALYWAVANHHLEVVEKLLAYHQSKTSSPSPTSVEIHTLTFEQIKRLAFRIRHVATPLELAAQVDDKAIFKVLLEYLEPFAETTILFNGIWAPCPSVPGNHRNLVHNTHLPSKEAYGNKSHWVRELMGTILQLAIKDEKLAIVDLLLRLGADVNAGQGPSKFTPLHVAAWCHQDPAYIRLILKYGADPNAKSDNGMGDQRTPLSIAIQKLNGGAVSALLEAGADPNGESRASVFDRVTPIYEACALLEQYWFGTTWELDSSFPLRMLRTLSKAGAKPEGVTPRLLRDIASMEIGAPLFKELVALGINLATSPGNTCVATVLAKRASWGAEHDYRTILDSILAAHGSLSNLRDAMCSADALAIRYSVILDYGLNIDYPPDVVPFYAALKECFSSRALGQMEVLMEAVYNSGNQILFNGRRCLSSIFAAHYPRNPREATTETVESTLGLLRILDHSSSIDPNTVTEMLFITIQVFTGLGAEFQRVVDAFLDMGAGLYHPIRSLAQGEPPRYFHDIVAFSVIYGRPRILSSLLGCLKSQGEGKESSLLPWPTWLKEEELHSARLTHGNDVDAALACLRSAGYLYRSDLAQAEYPLAVAILRGDVELVRKLVSWGLDVNWQDDAQWTLLHVAVEGGCSEMVDILLQANASKSINVQAERLSINLGDENTQEIYRVLRCAGLFAFHVSPLHLAVFKGDPPIVRSLLEYGADIHAPMNKLDITSSSVLTASNIAKALDLALFSRTDSELWRKGKTSIPGPLHPNRLDIATMLVEQGARMSASIAAQWKKLTLDEVIDKFSRYPSLWDMFVAAKLQEDEDWR